MKEIPDIIGSMMGMVAFVIQADEPEGTPLEELAEVAQETFLNYIARPVVGNRNINDIALNDSDIELMFEAAMRWCQEKINEQHDSP